MLPSACESAGGSTVRIPEAPEEDGLWRARGKGKGSGTDDCDEVILGDRFESDGGLGSLVTVCEGHVVDRGSGSTRRESGEGREQRKKSETRETEQLLAVGGRPLVVLVVVSSAEKPFARVE